MASKPGASGRLLAIVLGLQLLSACGAPALGFPVLKQLTRAEIVGVLAASGVAVVNDPADAAPVSPVTGPASPFALTVWQVDHLSLDLKSGGSIAGFQLDEYGAIGGIPADAPPFSYLLAGWISKYESSGASKAREIMGDQDWAHPAGIVFPHLVLLLFVSDIARDALAAEPAADTPLFLAGPRAGPAAPILVGVGKLAQCPLTGWIDSVLNKIFNALKVNEEGDGILGVLSVIWNLAVELAKTVIKNLLTILAAPVVASIKTTVTIVGVLSLVASLVAGFDVSVTHEGATHFAHPGQPDQTGKFTAKITSPLGEWPGYILACARDIGLSLPDPNPVGKQITWEAYSVGEPVASVTGLDYEISDGLTAVLTYTTLREGPLDPPLREESDAFRVIPRIEIFSDADLEKFTDGLFFGGAAGGVLKALLGDLFVQAHQKIQEEALQIGDGWAFIGWHEEEEPTPTPTVSETPTETPTASPTGPPTPPPTKKPPTPKPTGKKPPPCVPASKCPSSNGDPHIRTIDEGRYDFMATGEFTLVRSVAGDVEIQVRQEPYPGEAAVTVNTAVATRIGETRVVISMESGTAVATIDGAPVVGETTSVGSSTLTHRLDFFGIDLPDGTTLFATGQGDAGLNLLVAPSDALRQSAQGLLGLTPQGEGRLPLLPDGSEIPATTDAHERFVSVYETFADAWRITPEESLFDYAIGTGPGDFDIPGYPSEAALVEPDLVPPAEWQAALQACAEVADEALREQCAFDIYVTGDTAFTTTYTQTEQLAANPPLPAASPATELPDGLVQVLDDVQGLSATALSSDGVLLVAYRSGSGVSRLASIDSSSGLVLGDVELPAETAVAAAGSTAWMTGPATAEGCSVSGIDPRTLGSLRTLAVTCPPFGLSQLAGTADAAWYSPLGGELTRIDALTGATSEVATPFSGGFLETTPTAVFYSSPEMGYYRLTAGSQAFEPVGRFAAAFPGGDGVWVQTDETAGFFTSQSGPSASIPLAEGSELVAADDSSVYAAAGDLDSQTLSRIPIAGSAQSLASISDVATASGQVDLEYANDQEQAPLLVGRSVIVKLWLMPALDPGSTDTVLVMQATELP